MGFRRRRRRPDKHRLHDGENSDDLEALRREAKRLGQRGDWGPEATRVNTRILEREPDNLAALTRRGRCFLEQDNYPAAKEDYSRALRIYPASKLVKEALAKIERGWDAALQRGEKRAAERRNHAEKKRMEAEELRRIQTLTSFEEARSVGVAASGANPPNYPIAIAAFKKAYELDPRRKVKPGEKTSPGLFEIPTRLARVYRGSGQLYQAQRMYEWILERHDSRHAKVGLAAVHEDKRRHSVALKLYEEVLAQNPGNPYALRGIARTLSSLDRVEEAVAAYERALAGAKSSKDAAAAAAGLKKMREELKQKGKMY